MKNKLFNFFGFGASKDEATPEGTINALAKAVGLALKACELTQWKKWNHIGTLGATYAETGDFTPAIKYQTQAMTLDGISEVARAAAQGRLGLYAQKKPFHDKSIL